MQSGMAAKQTGEHYAQNKGGEEGEGVQMDDDGAV